LKILESSHTSTWNDGTPFFRWGEYVEESILTVCK
jgi:hypothetical protein